MTNQRDISLTTNGRISISSYPFCFQRHVTHSRSIFGSERSLMSGFYTIVLLILVMLVVVNGNWEERVSRERGNQNRRLQENRNQVTFQANLRGERRESYGRTNQFGNNSPSFRGLGRENNRGEVWERNEKRNRELVGANKRYEVAGRRNQRETNQNKNRNGFRSNVRNERRNRGRYEVASRRSQRETNRFSSNNGGSCVLSQHCVPPPIQEDQGYYYVPECITLPVCSGGCGDGSTTCHATRVRKEQVKVKIYKNEGGTDFEYVKEASVTVERAEECGCAACAPRNSCARNKRWDDCKCVCSNGRQASSCGSEKQWSEEFCECQCKPKRCGSDQFLDPITCRCMYISASNDFRS